MVLESDSFLVIAGKSVSSSMGVVDSNESSATATATSKVEGVALIALFPTPSLKLFVLTFLLLLEPFLIVV